MCSRWLVVEDAAAKSAAVADVLAHTGADFVHLSAAERGSKLQSLSESTLPKFVIDINCLNLETGQPKIAEAEVEW